MVQLAATEVGVNFSASMAEPNGATNPAAASLP